MPLPVGYCESHSFFTLGTNTREAECVIGWRITTPPFTQSHADELMVYLQSEFATFCAADVEMPGGYVIVGIDGGNVRYDSIQSDTGTYAGSSAAPQVAILVRKTSALGGRRNRGRMYIPGPPEGQVEPGGRLNPTYRGQVQSEVEDLLGDLPAAAANVDQMVIFHQEGSPTPTVVTELVVDGLVATQRRRVGRK